MNARHYYRYSLMLLVLSAVFCPAAGVRAQYIKKETLPIKGGGEQEFAVFYADGMPETAQWPLGTVIVDDVGRTTRHQVSRGNGATAISTAKSRHGSSYRPSTYR